MMILISDIIHGQEIEEIVLVRLQKDINGDSRDINPDIGCYEWDCDVEDGGIVLSTQTICSNQPVTLDVYGFEAQYFKWLKSADNNTWVDIASSDTNLYTTDTLIDTMFYRTAASCDNIAWDSSASIAVYVNHNNYYMDNAADGGSDANDGSEGSPWATMVYALTQMTCGDTLDIKEGTYTEDAITIADNTQEIYIRGAGRTTTIFDGDQTERWLEVLGSTSKGITITDMTIKDMKATNEEGLGIKVNGGTKILIEDITFDNCSTSSSTWGGGGIATFGASQVKVNRCIFTNNWGGSGSGIHFRSLLTESMLLIVCFMIMMPPLARLIIEVNSLVIPRNELYN